MKILALFVGLALVGGGAWYVLQKQDASEAPSQSQEAGSDAPSNESGKFRGSLQQLMARSGSWRCDVSMTTEGVTSTGTTYVANGNVRADFVSNIPQVGSIESHMIMKDNTAYTWTSMAPQGFKFPISGQENQPEVSAEVAAQINQAYDYDCRAWPTDESKFALPSGITF